jgi:hypothetical protein
MRPDRRTLLPDFEVGSLIPPIIHQTYPTLALPEDLQANVDQLKVLNPDWEYRLYDDRAVEQFIHAHYGEGMLRLFRTINPAYGAARADLFRYLAVYRLGGVYLDIKSRFQAPIDRFINAGDRFVVSQWSNGPGERYEGYGIHSGVAQVPGGEYQQWHVIAAPGSPFLRAVLKRVCANIAGYRLRREGVGWVPVLQLTGPIAYTLVIDPLLEVYPNRRVRREAELGLDYSIRPGHQHRSLFGQHYSQNRAPIVRRNDPAGWFDAAYYRAREAKRRIRALRGLTPPDAA